jgi:hypothetical protein
MSSLSEMKKVTRWRRYRSWPSITRKRNLWTKFTAEMRREWIDPVILVERVQSNSPYRPRSSAGPFLWRCFRVSSGFGTSRHSASTTNLQAHKNLRTKRARTFQCGHRQRDRPCIRQISEHAHGTSKTGYKTCIASSFSFSEVERYEVSIPRRCPKPT